MEARYTYYNQKGKETDDEESAYAVKKVCEESVLFYCLFNKEGLLYNPEVDDTPSVFLKNSLKNRMRKVSEECFTSYLAFLQKNLGSLLNVANRHVV